MNTKTSQNQTVNALAQAVSPSHVSGQIRLENHYIVEFHDPAGNLLRRDEFDNLVVTAGLNDNLTQYFKGSAYTAAFYVLLITGIDGNIAAVTKANPGSVNAPLHGLTTGQKVLINGVGGMTQLNGNTYTVTVSDANNFTIGVDSTGYTTYTSGGTFTLQPGLAADTMASHANWTECVAYSEGVRQTLTLGSVSAGAVDNSAAKAVFTINANGTKVGGAGVTTNSTKSGTSGTLYGLGAFSGGDMVLSSGSTITVQISLSATSG